MSGFAALSWATWDETSTAPGVTETCLTTLTSGALLASGLRTDWSRSLLLGASSVSTAMDLISGCLANQSAAAWPICGFEDAMPKKYGHLAVSVRSESYCAAITGTFALL